jgi:hypothetical protein
MKTTQKFTQQQDNLICTFVRLYRFNVAYGLKRASEFTGIKRSLVVSRYYRHLRNNKQIFSVEFGDRVIWNTRAMKSTDLDELRKFEKFVPGMEFDDLEKRAWWVE